MRIVNKEKNTTVGQISIQGDWACMAACGVVCALTSWSGTAIGVAFVAA